MSHVFHARLPNFEIHAERMVDSTLATRPVAVITSPAQNGTILSLSQEAREEGLAVGMRISLARKISRQVALLPFHNALYQKMQGILFQRLIRFSPAVEPAGFGRFFLDMSGMQNIYQTFNRAGHLLIGDLHSQLDLTPRVGIGRNKLVSAIATTIEQDEPVLEVPQGDEPHWLAPLRSTALPIAREKPVQQVFSDLNMQIVQDVQQLVAREYLRQAVFGLFARRVAAQSQGIDTAIVRPMQLGGKIGTAQIVERHTLPEDTNDEELLLGAAQLLAESVGHQLRKQRQVAAKVTLQIHYSDGYSTNATGRLSRNDAFEVAATIVDLYCRANSRRGRIRSLTLEAAQLQSYARQLSLFETGSSTRPERLSLIRDQVNQRFGSGSLLPVHAIIGK